MKIAFVCPSFYPFRGGVETVVLQLASHLATKGHEVTVLTQSTNNQLPTKEKMHNFTVLRFPTIGIGDLKISFALLHYLQKESTKYDLLHTQNYHSFPALCAAYTKKTPIIFSPHYHGTGHSLFTRILHYPYRIIGRLIFSQTDTILCDTDAEAALIHKHFPRSKAPKIIALGIDVQGIQKAKKNKKISPSIVSIGRLERYKNVALIIKSMQFVNNNTNLIIVGSGPEKKRLQNLVRQLHLSRRISFLKNISNHDLYHLLTSAKAYITMSCMEAYGLTLLEAVAATIGVVASDIPSHKEITKRFGIHNIVFLRPDSSPTDLADAISYAIANPTQTSNKLPSWNLVTEETLQVYKKIL